MPNDLLSDEQVGLSSVLSDQDVGLGPPKITLSPYEQARVAGTFPTAMGPMGPANPQEVLRLGDLSALPGQALGTITGAASDLMSDWLRRTGIDPSAAPGKPTIETGPLPITNIPGTGFSPLRAIAPEFTKGVERKAGEIVSGFTEPGQAAILPFAPASKGVQALFAGQAATQIPEAVKSIAQSKTPEELGQALTGAGTDIAMAYMLGKGVLKDLPSVESKSEPPAEPSPAPETEPPGPPPTTAAPSITPPSPAEAGAPVPAPEVASMGPPKAGGKDPFGNPLGTKYYATTEDWSKWQDVQNRLKQAKESKDFNAMAEIGKEIDPIKNKYGGQAPEPPKLDPDTLRAAVKVEGKNLVGEPGETHSDILERNGIDPRDIPHSDERRGFVDVTNPEELITRKDAEKRSGLKGTADAGGLDSMDLPNAPRLRLEREMAKAEEPPAEIAVEVQPAPAEITRPKATTADILGKVSSRLDAAADAARARLASQRQKGVGGQFNLGPLGELENIKDFAIIGAAKIAKGATEFARWSGEMIKDFGEGIKPHLDNIFARAQQTFDDHASVVTRVNRVLYEAGLPRRAIAEAGKKSVGTAIESGVRAGKSLAESEAQPVIESLQQQLTDSIPKAQALREYFRGQETGGAAGRKAATEELKLADKWLEADAARIRESLVKLANESLPVSERGRFLNAITDATRRVSLVGGDPEVMYRRAAQVAARIEDRASEVRKAGLANQIKDAVAKAVASPGVDIGYKNRILNAVRRISFSKPLQATTDALKATRDYLARQEAAGNDVEMPKEVLDGLEVLSKIPVSELPEHILEAVRGKVQLLDQLGRLKVKARKQAWEIEKNSKLQNLADERTNPVQERPQFRQQPGDPRPLSLRIRNWVNKQLDMGTLLDKALLPIDALFDLLGDAKGTYKGWLFKNVRNPLDLGFNEAQVMRDAKTAPLEAIIKAHNLGERESERIGVYAAAQQEGGIARMVEMGVKPETIDGILKSITPAELSAYKAMRAAMDSTLPEVQKLMHELYNIDVKPVPNYFPMPRDWTVYEPEPKPLAQPKYGQEMGFDELSGWKQMLGDFTTPKTTKSERGFTLERQKRAATPIKLNAFDVFFQHMNDVSYLLKTQRDLKMIGEMARGDLFKEKYGNVGQNIVTSWLDTVARQGRIGGFRRIPMLDELRRRTSAGVIGFRLASQFVHLSNIPLAVWRTGGPLWWKAGLGESLSERGQNFLKDNFAETFARGGGEPALVEASQSDLSVFGKQIVPKAVVRASFAIARQIDRYNAQATTLGTYLRLISEKGLDARNYDKIPVDKDAQAQALVLSRRAVASPLPKDVSASLARGAITGGNISLGRTIFQFQNIFQDQWSNIRHDLARAGIRENNPKLAATAFVSLAAMLLAEMGIREGSKEIISSVTGSQPKKEKSAQEKIAVEAARRIPFGGQITSQILYGETGVPAIDSIVSTEKAIKTAATAKKEATQQKALIRALSGAAQLGGVPGASQVGELIEKSQ